MKDFLVLLEHDHHQDQTIATKTSKNEDVENDKNIFKYGLTYKSRIELKQMSSRQTK